MANRQSLSQVIVKQGYLRKAPTSNMFTATFKKAPLRWFVFGLRSHVGPYLEYYEDESSILTAPPINSVGLNQAQHMTYCINGPKYDHTISITLADRVLTLVADGRGEMNEWFQAIQTKLVEIGILTEVTNTLSTVRENTYTSAPTLERPRTNIGHDESDLADSHNERRDPEQDTTDGTGSAYDFASIEEVVANRRNEVAESKTSIDSTDDTFSPYVNSQASNGVLVGNVYENTWVAAPNTHQRASQAYTPLEMNQAGNASLKPVMSKDSETLRKCDINDNKCQSNDAPSYMNVQTGFQNPDSAFVVETGPPESNPNGIFMQVNEEDSYEAIWSGQQAESWSPERARSQNSQSSRLLHFVETTDSKNALADETNPLMLRSENTQPKVYDQHLNGLHPTVQLSRKLQELGEDLDEPPPPYSPPEGASALVPAIERRRKVSLKSVVPSADRQLIGQRAQSYVNQPRKRSSSSSVENHERRHSARSAAAGQHTAQLQRSVTLKHSQIELLKDEMNHAAGVRVVLRKVDSYKGIAFVDCIGAVWVAGWNLRDHPYLHGAFHVGDQLVSINKQVVQTARMAQKIIKHSDDMKLEFIVRRVPHAKVFSVQRRAEGESLGMKRDGGTAEIVYIDANGLAGNNGLKSKAKSLDGSTLTNWTLTEINNRPLNLFFKDNEIEHRLNAVGKDISFMVQPADFVKLLKKQLKSLKNFKDYLVQ